jgi:ABC-type antimicrobial peptide transport system permease subunit
MAVILVATVFGGGTAAYYAMTVTQHELNVAETIRLNPGIDPSQLTGDSDSFYTDTLKLIAIAITIALLIAALGQLVSIVEAIVSRRRTYAALVATGVPRATLGRTAVWQALAAAGPAVVFGTVVGVGMLRLLGGAEITTYAQSSTDTQLKIVTAVPWPWAQMGLTIGVALAAVLLTTGIGMLFIKSSTSVEELRTA